MIDSRPQDIKDAEALIFNKALLRLKQGVGIEKLDSDSKNKPDERTAALVYPDARRAVLRAHDWGFARVPLSRGSCCSPCGRWHTVPRPHDCVAVRACNSDGESVAFSMDSRGIVARSPFDEIVYTRDEDDLGKWDSLAYQCLMEYLCKEIAEAITSRTAPAQMHFAIYEKLIGEAKKSDLCEGRHFYDTGRRRREGRHGD